ncbi:HIT family protein [Chitinasiproducens palmae]|uniref:Histidine triad (HIT) family protein n=1 Tax=Chitinasiproducens palmae TaxID=1770053 RepID=A0A1H2PKE5_9BURK|nr:HIT family protein [Chitinasiproducens palmae]SDV46398.1 histidine triad (HIT) family protein [Chitinasiproducens palmae]
MSYQTDNIFARILRGELPCVKVYEDAHTIAFMDIMPQAEGHLLVIPREGAASLLDLSAEAARETIVVVQKLARAAKQAFDAPGIQVVQMNGSAAGQTVFHCHFHVIPRQEDAPLRAHATEPVPTERLEALAQKVRAALAQT